MNKNKNLIIKKEIKYQIKVREIKKKRNKMISINMKIIINNNRRTIMMK
jgi:hypothetical protein